MIHWKVESKSVQSDKHFYKREKKVRSFWTLSLSTLHIWLMIKVNQIKNPTNELKKIKTNIRSSFTSGSLPSDTRLRALQPSDPIHEKVPVALLRRTARITSRTSWSEPKIIAPKKKRKIVNKFQICISF